MLLFKQCAAKGEQEICPLCQATVCLPEVHYPKWIQLRKERPDLVINDSSVEQTGETTWAIKIEPEYIDWRKGKKIE